MTRVLSVENVSTLRAGTCLWQGLLLNARPMYQGFPESGTGAAAGGVQCAGGEKVGVTFPSRRSPGERAVQQGEPPARLKMEASQTTCLLCGLVNF